MMEKETKNSAHNHNTNEDDDEDDLEHEKTRHRYEQIDHSRHSRQQVYGSTSAYGEIPPQFQNAESRAQYEEYIHQYGDQYNIYHRNPYFQYIHPGYRHIVTHEQHGEDSATNDDSHSIHEQHQKDVELREHHATHNRHDDDADNVHAAVEENHHTIQESNKTAAGRTQKKSLKRPRDSQKDSRGEAISNIVPKHGENDRNGTLQKTANESKEMTSTMNQKTRGHSGRKKNNSDDERHIYHIQIEEAKVDDPVIIAQNELIDKSTPTSELEIALYAALARKEFHVSRLAREIQKLQKFITKRKQTYKRKRKEDNAPTRPLSAYNIYIQDRFALLAKENEKALKSDDVDAQMKRVPPANLVAATGNIWKELPLEEKQKYEERYVRTCFVLLLTPFLSHRLPRTFVSLSFHIT